MPAAVRVLSRFSAGSGSAWWWLVDDVAGWTMPVRPPPTALRAKSDRILPHLDERRRLCLTGET